MRTDPTNPLPLPLPRPRPRPRTWSPPAGRGFTLIEVIVVLVILSILATLAVPKLSGTAHREFMLTGDRVGDLLIMFAQRDRLARQPVGIMHDTEDNSLLLMLMDEGAEGDRVGEWRVDPFVHPVRLSPVVDPDSVMVTADHELVNIRDWPLSHRPGEPRPAISIEMRSMNGEHEVTLELSPHALAPRRRGGPGGGSGAPAAVRVPIDLDAAGRAQEDW